MKTFVKAFFGDEKEAKKEEMLLLESRVETTDIIA